MKSWIRYRRFLTLELTLTPVFAGAGFLLNRYAGWPAWLAVVSSAVALTIVGLVCDGRSAGCRMTATAFAIVAPGLCLCSAFSMQLPSCRWVGFMVVMGLYAASLYAAYRSWPRWAMKPCVFTAATLSGWGLFLLLARSCPLLMERAVLIAKMIFVTVSGQARW